MRLFQYDDEAVGAFYEHIKLAKRKVKIPYTTSIGDFNTKIRVQQIWEHVVGEFGPGFRKSRGETLVAFAEIDNLRIINTYFLKRKCRKWSWKDPNGETENKIGNFNWNSSHDSRRTGDWHVKTTDPGIVSSRISLDSRRERLKTLKQKTPN